MPLTLMTDNRCPNCGQELAIKMGPPRTGCMTCGWESGMELIKQADGSYKWMLPPVSG